jgi:hypothetical protein
MTLTEYCNNIELELEKDNSKLMHLLEEDGVMFVRYKHIKTYLRCIKDKKEPDDLLKNSCRASASSIDQWVKEQML